MLEELEQRLNRKIRENSDSIHEMHEDFTDVCSKLVKKFTEENLTRDERIEEHHKLFSDLFGKLQRQVTEETNALESQVVDTRTKHDELLEDLRSDVTRQAEDLAVTCGKLERSTNERYTDLAEVLEEQRRSFTEGLAKVDNKFSEEIAGQDERQRSRATYSSACPSWAPPSTGSTEPACTTGMCMCTASSLACRRSSSCRLRS